MKAIIIISTLSCLLVCCSSNCRADYITIAADNWCPVNCDPSDSKPGIMVEIAEHVFSNAGHTVIYKILPWSRAIKLSREGEITGIIGAFVGDAPDFIFPENELLMISGNTFFVAKESTFVYQNISSLADVQLGAIRDYDYGELLNDYIKKGKNVQILSGENPLERMIQMLLIGRVDVVIEAAPVLWHTAAKMNVKDKLKAAGRASDAEKCYIAFSPKNAKSKEYAKILSDGIDGLRRSGELNKILNTYGIEDWK